jgi:hypothetical protein
MLLPLLKSVRKHRHISIWQSLSYLSQKQKSLPRLAASSTRVRCNQLRGLQMVLMTAKGEFIDALSSISFAHTSLNTTSQVLIEPTYVIPKKMTEFFTNCGMPSRTVLLTSSNSTSPHPPEPAHHLKSYALHSSGTDRTCLKQL